MNRVSEIYLVRHLTATITVFAIQFVIPNCGTKPAVIIHVARLHRAVYENSHPHSPAAGLIHLK